MKADAGEYVNTGSVPSGNSAAQPGHKTGPSGTETARPVPLPVQPDPIAAELREHAQWVVWRYEFRKGKWTKVPYNPRNGRAASSTDASTWATFGEALDAHKRGGWDGIGYALLADDPYTALDLDHCRERSTGMIAPWAQAILQELPGAYVEVTPSGEGLRIIARAVKPAGRCRAAQEDGGGLEVYDRARYVTITGHAIGEPPSAIPDLQASVKTICEALAPQRAGSTRKAVHQAGGTASHTADACPLPLTADEQARWRRFKPETVIRILSLWNGDISAYKSASEADLALCSLLAPIADGDRERLAALMGMSALGARCKWAERDDYRERTLDRALSTYKPWHSDPAGATGKKPATAAVVPVTVAPSATMPADPEPAAAAKDPSLRRPAARIIADHWRVTYAPTFRRGPAIYSAVLGREVRPGELIGAPTTGLIVKLAAATEAQRDESGQAIHTKLPQLYRTWAQVAWGDLAASLGEEGATGEIVAPAEEEFIAAMSAALLTPYALGHTHQDTSGGERTETQRRPVIQWAELFAKPGKWGDVRGLRLWSTRDPGNFLRVAFRSELMGQLRAGDLARMGPTMLTRLCHLYGLGEPKAIKGGSMRAIELYQWYIADLLAEGAPAENQKAATGEV